MYKQILFPVDFSDRCVQVRPLISALADECKAQVTLLHVIELPPVMYGIDPSFPIVAGVDQAQALAQTELEGFAHGNFARERLELKIEEGSPGVVISGVAQQLRADLIALPTHGYGGFRRFLLGSTTARVLHDANCAVWTAAHTDDPGLVAHLKWRNIVCALDGTECGLPLLGTAAELAAEFGSSVTIAHAVPYLAPGTPAEVVDTGRWLEDSARDYIQCMQKQVGTAFRVCVAPGSVAEVVRQAALSHRADLILIGRGRIHETLGRMRTHSYAIIREAPCPVLSV